MTQVAETLPHDWQAHLYITTNSIAVDDLATQGARASAAMVLIWFSWNILNSVSEGLLCQIILLFNSWWPSDAIWRQIWVNIGSGNGLLPDGTKPLPEPMLTDHQWSPVTFKLGQRDASTINH